MIAKENSVLLVVDVQERLVSTIFDVDRILLNIGVLVKAAQVHRMPVLLTEQMKLGDTVLEIKEIFEGIKSYNPIKKIGFSCYRNKEFRQTLESVDCLDILVCGIEAHICVSQTALDLLDNGYRVQVVEDAVSSHRVEDKKTAVERLRDAGATVTCTEALLYELTVSAQAPEFKKILELTKYRRKVLYDQSKQ